MSKNQEIMSELSEIFRQLRFDKDHHLLKVQSNGMGQQSVAMYLMSCDGDLPKLDYSIFADPGKEKQATYNYLDYLKRLEKKIPIIIENEKNLYKDLLKASKTGNRVASLPYFTKNGGLTMRQCTSEYKITPVENAIRRIQGKKKGQSFDLVEVWFGISLDEMDRMFKPKRKNVIHVYPFCGYQADRDGFKEYPTKRMTRSEIIKWIEEKGYKIPPKSACVFCPFQNNRAWKELSYLDWEYAKVLDKAIRQHPKMTEERYLHRSCKPIDEVEFSKNQTEINYDCFGYCST